MHFPHDDLYYDRTWFDALGDWLGRRMQRMLPGDRVRLWTIGFAAFAALCVACAAGLAAQAVLFENAWNHRAADLLAGVLLLITARHFLAVTGRSAANALAARKPIARPPRAPAVAGAVAGAAPAPPVQRPDPADVAASAQTFFRALRAAGVNVRIAQSLYAAGFRSATQVRSCSDAQLLATPGVGRATLRKLRIQFGVPIGDQSSSNAA